MKRLIPLVVAVGLAAAACGSSSSSTSSTTAASSSGGTSATTAASSGGTTASTSGGSSSGSVDMKVGNPTTPVTLNEDGSSLLYPYLQELVAPLHAAYSNITLSPAAGGSGKGIADATSGTSDMGGSDAYLSSGVMAQHASLENVPIAVSAQAVNYNLQGVTGLKLSGDVLAQIYQGKITKWNDPAIAALNSGTTLPSTTIVPVRRVDSSGDTFLFSSFLSATNSAWSNGPSIGTTVTWPSVPGELSASGNPGMVQTCNSTPGCVAYIGISAETSAQNDHLGEAMLQSASGEFLLPNMADMTAAAQAVTSIPANLAVSLIYQKGQGVYPIVNFEYLVVNSQQSDAGKAMAIRTFLAFAISPTGGSTPALLSKESFVALPSGVLPAVETAIAKIGG